MFCVWILYVYSFLTTIQRKSTCRTTNEPGSNAKNASCQFPFTIGDHTFDACTTEKDPEGKLWCSTKVDSNGDHVRGHWGHCEENCQTDIKPVDQTDIKPVDNSIIRFVITYFI